MAPDAPTRAPRRSVGDLVERIRVGGPSVVALSGGVDSGLVASLAFEALGPHAAAVTLTGNAVAAREADGARELARFVGIDHAVVEVDPLAREGYRRNDADRCYHCRSVESEAIRRWARDRAGVRLLDGVHLDDLGDDRPGIRAMDEAGFLHPLLWAGWRKADVRAEAARRGLPNWNRPSDACLASRVARGQPITAELLARVEEAERRVHARGFRRVRVRVDGTAARLEVDPEELARLDLPELRAQVVDAIAGAGFDRVTIDPRGYGRAALPVVR